MALTDRLDQAPTKPTGKPCSVGALLDRLDGAERDALNAMLYELGWSQAKIVDALEAEGYYVGKQTPNRHRSRSCGCFTRTAGSNQ